MYNSFERVADWAGPVAYLLNDEGLIIGEGKVSRFTLYINDNFEIVDREESHSKERTPCFSFIPDELTTKAFFKYLPEVELKVGFVFDVFGEPIFRRHDWSDAHEEFTIVSKIIYEMKNKEKIA